MLGANISAVAIPDGASHFLVYSANSFGEMIVPFSAPIQDMYVWNLLFWLSVESKSNLIPIWKCIWKIGLYPVAT